MIRQNILNNSSSKFNSPNKSISTPNKQTPTRNLKNKASDKRRSKSSFSTLQSSKPKVSTENRSKFQIKTYVRIRKEFTPERKENDDNPIVPSFTDIGTNFTKIANSEKSYKFDQIFTPSDKQPIIFENVCEELLDSALRGFNVCIFAYGFTGTGKTYTMFGDRVEPVEELVNDSVDGAIEESNLGMIQRLCKELFISKVASIKVSFYEIYAEKVRDLLQDSENNELVHLKVRESTDNSFYVDSLEFECKNLKTLMKVIDLGLTKRATSATTSNNHSSRSHAILSLSFEHKRQRSKIKLVDLAGAEHAGANYKNNKSSKITPRKSIRRSVVVNSSDAKTQQSLLNEGVMINRSLLTLGRCITILSSNEHETHVPYRESVITKLLKDSLGGNSKTAMIATCSEFQELEGLNSTLRFAESVSNITNHVQVNRSVEKNYSTQQMFDLQNQIEKLENQLSARDLELKNQISKPSLVLLTEDPSLSKMVVKVLPVFTLENVNADFEIFEESDDMDTETPEIRINLGFGNIIVNGAQLKPGVTTLFHGDRIVFDEEHFYALNQPSSKNSVRTLINYQQAKDEHISALNSRLQEKDLEIGAQKNKLNEVEQMVKRQKFENLQNEERIKSLEEERIRKLEKEKAKKINQQKVAKDRRENVKKIKEELKRNKEGLEIDFRKDVLAKFREKRSSGEVDRKTGYLPKIQENPQNSFIESLTGKRKSTELSMVCEENSAESIQSKDNKNQANIETNIEATVFVPLHRPLTDITGSEFYQIIHTAKQLEYLVSYENVSNHTINCLIHSFHARVALFSETNRYSNFTNPDLTTESEKLSAKIKTSFNTIFDEFYTENSVFDVNELRTVIKHLVSYGLTLEESDFSGNWDFTDGFGKSVMFKAVREGAKSMLKKSIDKMNKQFCEIINENGMSANDTSQQHKLKTIKLVEKTMQVLNILQKHLENCFEDYELNYEVTAEKLLKTGQKVLFSIIEFCAGVRKAVINAFLEEGVVDDIDGIADLMTNLDNDALEFTVLFERDESGSMVKRMVDGFTELFDVLDEMERDGSENETSGDFGSMVVDSFDKENLKVAVTPVFIRSSTLKSEYRTKSTMDTYSPFKLK